MLSRIKRCLRGGGLIAFLALSGGFGPSFIHAEDATVASATVQAPTDVIAEKLAVLEKGLVDRKVAADTLWVLVTAFLVFWMNAGFALVESGMCRAKNAVNILSKNFIVFAISSLAFTC
jgi:Amt family ammonium transporter